MTRTAAGGAGRASSPDVGVTTPRHGPALGATGVGFRADIQGLRAIAVLAVLAYHAHVPGITGGYVGVDVFFVISGFLISAHLFQRAGSGRIGFADFYARRVRRILPASVAVIALTLVAVWIWVPPLVRPTALRDGLFTALYVPNIHFSNAGVDYLADPNPSVFQHYWSLGVEEQFYLVWPLLIALALLIGRRSPRAVLALLLLVGAASFALCVWLTGHWQPDAFFLMPPRAWEFAAGGLVAYVTTSTAVRVPRGFARAGAWLGLAGLAASLVVLDDATVFPGIAALLPVASTALLILCGTTDRPGTPSRLLGTRPMKLVGAISYSLYLVHWPLLVIPQMLHHERHPLPLAATVALAVLAVPVAWLMYRYVETPWRRAPRGQRPRVALLGAGAAAAVLALVCVVGVRMVEAAPLHTDREVAPTTVREHPEGTGYVPSNLTPSLRDAAGDNATVYASGCHLQVPEAQPVGCESGPPVAALDVVLFGDSHAAQWHPALDALAQRGELRLTSHTKSNCTGYDVTTAHMAAPYPECVQWRERVLATIEADPPDVVVLAGFAEGDESIVPMQEWTDGIAATVERLAPITTVLVLADTPSFPVTPATCLSAHLDHAAACDRPVTHALDLDRAAAEEAATIAAGGSYADLTDYLCTDVCPVIQGNTLVYRDSHHLTATFSALMADVLLDAIVTARAENPPDRTSPPAGTECATQASEC